MDLRVIRDTESQWPITLPTKEKFESCISKVSNVVILLYNYYTQICTLKYDVFQMISYIAMNSLLSMQYVCQCFMNIIIVAAFSVHICSFLSTTNSWVSLMTLQLYCMTTMTCSDCTQQLDLGSYLR